MAHAVFWLLDLLALAGVLWCVQDFMRVQGALAGGTSPIPLDSGIYYLLVGTVLWLMTAIQIVGLKRGQTAVARWASPVILAWFAGTLVLANVLPDRLADTLTAAGYHAIDDPREISRLSRGKSVIYVKERAEKRSAFRHSR
jgi:hypothetical protein